MTQDLIRGPEPLDRPTGDLLYDNHLNREGWYAIDYKVPIATPVVPTLHAFRTRDSHDRTGGVVLGLFHRYGREGYKTVYAHLDEIAEIISKGAPYISPRDGLEYRDNVLNM